MPEEKVESNKKTKAKKIRSIIEWIVSGVFIAAAAALIIFKVVQSKSGKALPLFGTYYCTVVTDSMEPEYKVKDVLVIKEIKPTDIKVGDDITFYWKNVPYPITHRVEEIRPNESGTGDYQFIYVVHGINTQSNQCGDKSPCDITGEKQYPTDKALVGKVARKSPFLKALTSVWSLIFLILVPSAYLLISTVLDMFKKLDEQNDQAVANSSPVNESLNGLSQKDIERLKKEMLDDILNKGKK